MPIPGTERGSGPFFSPDGRSVGFLDNRVGVSATIKKVALGGGPAVTVAEARGAREATWGPDEVMVFGRGGPPSSRGLWRVSALGGEPEQITRLEEGEVWHIRPLFLPDGDTLLFESWSEGFQPETAQLVALSLTTGDRRVLMQGTNVRYATTGHLVFARGSSLWRVAFDAERLEMTGDPVPVLENVEVQVGVGGPTTP